MLEPSRELDLALEPLGAEGRGQFGMEHLERDGAIVAEIPGEIDRRHAAATELTLDGVAPAEASLQLISDRGQGLMALG